MTKPNIQPPSPMAGPDAPVDWLFAFKFNSQSFPGCTDDGTTPVVGSTGIFGGTVDVYKDGHSQQYVYATSASTALAKGSECLGATLKDPLGVTFGQIYNNSGYYYVLWNDQFYNNPIENMDTPWGHSKGMVAWDGDGNGMVLQVSTPSWPASGSAAHPRQNDGNTLGCINDDDIEVSQHFFALKLTKADLVIVLRALANASVPTSLSQPSLVNNGGPADIQALVHTLGKQSAGKQVLVEILSTGIKIISKPSALAVPPWQMVSAQLGGVNLRVASWWAAPAIYSTVAGETPSCWAPGIGTPGAVDIATSGQWSGTGIGLEGGFGPIFNHAKIGISTDAGKPLCIFGDMNQQGGLSPNYAHPNQPCSSSQNGRGGTFYVVSDAKLWASLTSLLKGNSAPVKSNDGSNVSTPAAASNSTAKGGTAQGATTKTARRAPTKIVAKTTKKAAKTPAKKATRRVVKVVKKVAPTRSRR